ncbi:hypothetical protein GRS48_03960 [Halorubrum sp. JWXQ-INN 858]|uniref:hypothetical protein n=1 Tax=Halorubrum sp. JWXQ-INN 858 TaxID=2690782 RepID=UPI001357456A|nr:hypothetical protein [Halorubrum sp. JWXQ-INN 858]MWV63980.1 hypothetical protein [Halorubrum sp. JWXQ-INN 858]
MPTHTYKIDEVFGMARGIPENYVRREYVDNELEKTLHRNKHVVIYGGSKQGKTCLRKSCITEDSQIVVQCNNRWDLEDIHSAILKKSGFKITKSEKRSISGSQKITAKIRSGLLSGGSETTISGQKEVLEEGLELDPEDVNDVIDALDTISFSKKIVLEDFHYLPEDTQEDFSVALKAFHETSDLNFVIVGVWLEENKLIVKNGDLTGRVISVNADKWTSNDLEDVIKKGADLLDIEFDAKFKKELIKNCHDSVFIVQEACQEACLEENILDSSGPTTVVGTDLDANEIIAEIIDSQKARYESFIRNFSDGFQSTELEMYKWLLYPILTADSSELEEGLIYGDMRKKIESQHPEGTSLNPGNLTQSLQSTGSLQADLGIKPFILDYDKRNSKLSVVDRGFLIWSQTEDEASLLEYAGLDTQID